MLASTLWGKAHCHQLKLLRREETLRESGGGRWARLIKREKTREKTRENMWCMRRMGNATRNAKYNLKANELLTNRQNMLDMNRYMVID
jgi:hypothetical protein